MKYADIDPLTGFVLGWIDTDAYGYPDDAFNGRTLEELTDEQWTAFSGKPAWRVKGAKLGFALDEPTYVLSLEEMQRQKLSDMSTACEEAILAGIKSEVLGTENWYPTKLTDQANMNAELMQSLLSDDKWTTNIWCIDDAGVEEYRKHDRDQVRTLGSAMNAHISSQRQHRADLEAKIKAATTVKQVEAINW